MSEELSVVEQKIQEIQKKYNGIIEKRNGLVKEIKACDEEINKLTGAYQSLMEVKQQLTPKSEMPPDIK